MMLCGWLVPMHLRAVDASVLHRAGEGRPSLVERGLALERANNPDAPACSCKPRKRRKYGLDRRTGFALATHSGGEALFPAAPGDSFHARHPW
jgi:hypothetical protein